MKRFHAAQRAKIMKAYGDGSMVQSRKSGSKKAWVIDVNPSFNFVEFEYRVQKGWEGKGSKKHPY